MVEATIAAATAESDTKSLEPVASAGPRRFHIITWGCQMNADDSDQIKNLLEADGLVETDDPASADVVMLNTCSVRQKPEDKVFSKLGHLAELKQARPGMTIGVTGCMAQRAGAEIARRAPHIDLVAGTAQMERIPELIRERRSLLASGEATANRASDVLIQLQLPRKKQESQLFLPERKRVTTGKLKSFVSIMYGCDKFCAFCIVPLTRGKERSRPAEDIVAEVRHLAAHGTREVTLLGQTVNSYGLKGLDATCSFSELLRRVNDVPGIERVRFTSPYPKDFTDDVIEAMATLPHVCEQVHLPVQVGDDTLLKRMHRGYTLDQYREIVRKLRAAMPDIAITTDLMLGFPGETEDQFQNTLRFVEEVRFDAAFMFAYSPRDPTQAASFPDQIPQKEKIRRLEALIAVQNEITCAINQRHADENRLFEVLVECRSHKDPNQWQGQTRSGKTTHFPAGRDLVGQFVQVRARKAHLWGLHAELI
ncbi:MAG: tRNA (N6-isopentenyl adenosine(37)-C2)-methylthiotransferase MiaB [Cytophagales bacterium]|nr:tRNA (N6-isopentenyl adenosine(37)-C2)-methylthiotransferase MiaB [Armatimonadota bacterium]